MKVYVCNNPLRNRACSPAVRVGCTRREANDVLVSLCVMFGQHVKYLNCCTATDKVVAQPSWLKKLVFSHDSHDRASYFNK